MASDDQTNQSESARKHLLEEIRRRAEEAEFKRLEDEDKTGAEASARLKQSQRAPFPVTAADAPVASSKAAIEQKILVLRERLLSALERGKAEKAAELFSELSKLIPDDPALSEYKVRLITLQEERVRSQEKPRVSPTRTRETSSDKAEREVRRKKIADMLDVGNSYYQQEKYDKALQYVAEVLKVDPENAEAANLRAQISKARMLAEQILEEEERRRAHEQDGRATKVIEDTPAPVSSRPTDFWGSSLTGPKLESEYDLVPEEKGPVGPPRPPIGKRLVTRVSSVRIPVKPILTIAAILALGAAVWYVVDTIRNTVSPARYSVLILPAVPGDTSLTYIADGFAEDLISDMGRVADMRVVAPSTAFAFSGSSAMPVQIAKALGANYVLSWSMTRVQEKVALQFLMADTVRGKTLWSTKLQVPLRELPALRPEILRSLAGGMEVKMVANDGSSLLRLATNNEVAYNLYARGRSLLRRGDRFAPEEAIGLFEEALRLDPEFGEGYAALAWANMVAYETSPEMPQAHIGQTLSAVERALSTGLRTAEIFRAWGLAEQARGQYAKAIERFEQAVNSAPSDAEAQRRLAMAYAATGKIDLAVKAAQHNVVDDPGNITAHTVLGQIYQYRAARTLDNRDDYRAALRAYEQGLRLARDKSDYGSGFYADVLVQLQQSERAMNILLDRVARARESYFDFYKLGRVQQSAGKPIPEWQESFVRAREILTAHLAEQPDDAVAEAYLALVQTRLGAFKEAVAAITRAQQLAPGDVDVYFLTARMYALQKDKTQALDFLRKALSRRFSLGSILDLDYFNLYSEPEFAATLTR